MCELFDFSTVVPIQKALHVLQDKIGVTEEISAAVETSVAGTGIQIDKPRAGYVERWLGPGPC